MSNKCFYNRGDQFYFLESLTYHTYLWHIPYLFQSSRLCFFYSLIWLQEKTNKIICYLIRVLGFLIFVSFLFLLIEVNPLVWQSVKVAIVKFISVPMTALSVLLAQNFVWQHFTLHFHPSLKRTKARRISPKKSSNWKCENDCSIGAIGEKLCLTHNTDELLENREPTIDFPILYIITK